MSVLDEIKVASIRIEQRCVNVVPLGTRRVLNLFTFFSGIDIILSSVFQGWLMGILDEYKKVDLYRAVVDTCFPVGDVPNSQTLLFSHIKYRYPVFLALHDRR